MNLLVIVLLVALFIFIVTLNRSESFIDSVVVLPEYKNITPQQMADSFGGLDGLTRVFIKYKIPKESIKNPKSYPQIASYIYTQAKLD